MKRIPDGRRKEPEVIWLKIDSAALHPCEGNEHGIGCSVVRLETRDRECVYMVR